MSAGTLQPTTHKRQGVTKLDQEHNQHYAKWKSLEWPWTVPPTSTISPGTSSVAGSIEKQPNKLKH